MTVQPTPFAIQSGGESAALFRAMLKSLTGGRQGLAGSGDLVVTQRAAGVNMSVDVAGGGVFIAGEENTYQGMYYGENQGVQNLAIAASDPTNSRYDLVIARVRDAAYSGVTNTFSLEVVQGTAAASPADPALPSGSVFVLARVIVTAGSTTVSNGSITDLRKVYATDQYGLATALGGTIICTSSTRPTGYEGMVIYETDTDKVWAYSGTAWTWPHPLGLLGKATRTTNTANFSSIVYFDTVTVSPLPNRQLHIVLHTNVVSVGAAAVISVGIASNSGTILNQAYRHNISQDKANQVSVEHFMSSGVGGSTTFKISAFTDVNSAYLAAGATAATYLSVYDVGPA